MSQQLAEHTVHIQSLPPLRNNASVDISIFITRNRIIEV